MAERQYIYAISVASRRLEKTRTNTSVYSAFLLPSLGQKGSSFQDKYFQFTPFSTKIKDFPSKPDTRACPSFRRKIWQCCGSFSLSPVKAICERRAINIVSISLSKEGGLEATSLHYQVQRKSIDVSRMERSIPILVGLKPHIWAAVHESKMTDLASQGKIFERHHSFLWIK